VNLKLTQLLVDMNSFRKKAKFIFQISFTAKLNPNLTPKVKTFLWEFQILENLCRNSTCTIT